MSKSPIYYDTETTGVKPDRDRIIELAAYDAKNDRTFSKLINPGFPIPPDATAIHNITDEMVADAPSFEVVAQEFVEFCGSDAALIAHNNDAFDQPFLKFEFERASVALPEWAFVDSLKWSRKYRPDLPRHSLQHLREYHGFAANQAHRALDDVIILHKVFSEMIDDLTIDAVLKLLSAKVDVTHMPFGKHRGEPLNDVPKNYVKWLKESGALDKPDNKDLLEAFKQCGKL